MSYRGGGPPYRRCPGCVYVGNLPGDVKENEIEDLFHKFGRIHDIDVKRGRSFNGSSYAFVEFERVRDAEAAIRRRNGYSYYDYDLRVEFAGEKRGKERISDLGGPPKRSEFRVVVTNLPRGCRWQHLKDHMRKAGEVGYANVESGWGVVEYLREDDMNYALDKLDETEMSAFDSKATIRVKPDYDSYRGRRSRSRSREKRRSFSDYDSRDRYSPPSRGRDRRRYRSRDRSDSSYKSRSIDRDNSKSNDRDRSRSNDRDKSRSIDRDRSRSIERDRSRSNDRGRSKSVDREPSESIDRDRSRSSIRRKSVNSNAERSTSNQNGKSITPPPEKSRSPIRDRSRSGSNSPRKAHSPVNEESPRSAREKSISSPRDPSPGES